MGQRGRKRLCSNRPVYHVSFMPTELLSPSLLNHFGTIGTDETTSVLKSCHEVI